MNNFNIRKKLCKFSDIFVFPLFLESSLTLYMLIWSIYHFIYKVLFKFCLVILWSNKITSNSFTFCLELLRVFRLTAITFRKSLLKQLYIVSVDIVLFWDCIEYFAKYSSLLTHNSTIFYFFYLQNYFKSVCYIKLSSALIEDNLTIGLSKGPSESNPQICMIENMQNRTKFLKKNCQFSRLDKIFFKVSFIYKEFEF